MNNYFFDLPVELQIYILNFIPKLRDVKKRHSEFSYKY